MAGIALGGFPSGALYDCVCHRCIREKDIRGGPESSPLYAWKLSGVVMIVCETCGNKRCPHASDHRLQCTGSNAPDQPGSIYGRPTTDGADDNPGSRPNTDHHPNIGAPPSPQGDQT